MTHGICKAAATTVFSAPAEETDVAEDMRTASQMQTSRRMQSPQVDGSSFPILANASTCQRDVCRLCSQGVLRHSWHSVAEVAAQGKARGEGFEGIFGKNVGFPIRSCLRKR